MSSTIQIRVAVAADVPILQTLIETSVRGLQAHDYTPAQLEGALQSVYGVDSQLIADGTYFAAETCVGVPQRLVIIGCGGWSKRKTLYGGDHWTGRHDMLLDPLHNAAKIRAFFIHPGWARCGIGTLILDACETAAKAAGFTCLEMGATLTGVPFYRARGYTDLEHLTVPLGNGESLPIVRMAKDV